VQEQREKPCTNSKAPWDAVADGSKECTVQRQSQTHTYTHIQTQHTVHLVKCRRAVSSQRHVAQQEVVVLCKRCRDSSGLPCVILWGPGEVDAALKLERDHRRQSVRERSPAHWVAATSGEREEEEEEETNSSAGSANHNPESAVSV
jgi:hypothetical protein